MGFSGFVLERSIDRGWRHLEGRLLDALRRMAGDDVLVVSRRPYDGSLHGGEPYIQFCVWGERLVRIEASSNHHLHAESRLDPVQSAQLIGLGFRPPGPHDADTDPEQSTNFFIDLKAAKAPQLAKMAVRAMRDVFGIVHPAFLRFSGHLTNAAAAPGGVLAFQRSAASAQDMGTADAESLAFVTSATRDSGGPIAMPRSAGHLRQLIEEALAPVLSSRPLVDDNGDFVVPYHGNLLFVRSVDDSPVVAVFAQLASGITDLEAAAERVWLLNREVELVKFYLRGDRILAGCTLPASPFVGGQLRIVLSLVGQVCQDFEQTSTEHSLS